MICYWAKDDKSIDYHNNEWGIKIHDDIKLFEALSLEIMQAGLSWSIVLNKRDDLRNNFDNFDFNKIKFFDDEKIEKLMKNKNIIRNRLKIKAIINNAKIFCNVIEKYGSFNKYIYNLGYIYSVEDLTKDMKKLGFKFIGNTTVYSYLSAIGIINGHTTDCDFYNIKNKLL